MAASGSSVGTAFGIQIGLAIIVFLVFGYLRISSTFKRFYAPKRFDKTLDLKPRRLPPGFFSWMWVIFTYPEQELIEVAGLDSAMYIRTLQLGWEVFVKLCFWTMIVILPINCTGREVNTLMTNQLAPPSPPAPPPPAGCAVAGGEDEVQAKKYAFTTFDKLSMANLPASSPKLWAHLVVMYIVTFTVLRTLWRYNEEATLLRIKFLANSPRGGPSHTVLITDIPGMKHGTVVWYLRLFAGSTLFIMLPAGLKKKVLDLMEETAGKAGQVVAGEAIPVKVNKASFATDKSLAEPTAMSNIVIAMAKVADQNQVDADKLEEEKNAGTGTTGPRQRKFTLRASEGMQIDDKLDPWAQAGEVLGSAVEPKAHRVQHFIHDEMEFSYGEGCVAAVNPVWDTAELQPLINEYQAVRQKLEDYLDKCAYELRRRKPIKKRLTITVVGPTLGEWGTKNYGVKPVKVDAIEFWTARLKELSCRIPEVQAKCLKKAIPSAFVTFHTRATQVKVVSALHHHDETTWATQIAPEPKEIIWPSLAMRAWQRSLRSVLLWVVYLLMMMFYMIPVAAVQALIEVPKLADVPVLGTIVTLPFIRQVLEAIVPGLVLIIFLALMPTILAIFCRLSGMVSTSQVDFGVVTRYFYFQLVSVFLGAIVAGSLFSQLKQFVKEPSSIITILGVGIPMTATFFINYILVAGVGKTGIKHLRIPGAVIFYLLSKLAATPRARARLWADQYTLYGPTVPYYTIAFLLGVTYCCINPIISPVVLLYFSFSILSERYNNLYVFKREYESGGRLWQYVFNQFVVSMYVAQITMIILMSIKKFKYSFLLIPAPIITFAFHVACLRLFSRPWSLMSSHDAAMLDIKDTADRKGEAMGHEELQDIRNMYLSPVFKVREEDVDDLLREAQMVSRRINGESQEDIEADMEAAGYLTPVEDEDEWEAKYNPAKSTETLEKAKAALEKAERQKSGKGSSFFGGGKKGDKGSKEGGGAELASAESGGLSSKPSGALSTKPSANGGGAGVPLPPLPTSSAAKEGGEGGSKGASTGPTPRSQSMAPPGAAATATPAAAPSPAASRAVSTSRFASAASPGAAPSVSAASAPAASGKGK